MRFVRERRDKAKDRRMPGVAVAAPIVAFNAPAWSGSASRRGFWTTAFRSIARSVRASVLPLSMAMITGVPTASAVATRGQLLAYSTVPGAIASSTYRLKVNGEPIFVEKFGDVSIARFAFIGDADVELSASVEIVNARISPRSYNLTPRVSGRTLKFSLSQPRKLILQLDGVEKLLLFADGPERRPRAPGQRGVIDLGRYLVSGRDAAQPVTPELQRAIDETSAANAGAGGVLYVPAGLYMTAQLRLKSNVELYLHSGARIRAVPVFDTSNYPVQNGTDSSFIYIADASNVKIGGRGVIDGNGFNLRSNTPGGGNNKLLRTRSAQGVVLEDVYFRDSARWSLHFLHSDDVVVRGVKLVNDLRVSRGTLPLVSNTDGVDIDASRFVTVEDSFIYTTDDAFTPKVTGYMGLTRKAHDIVVRNNVIWTQKCAIKVGSEVLDDIYNVRFENNDTVLADRLVALWNEGGSVIHDISILFNRSETIGVRDNQSFYYFYIREKPGSIHDVVINGTTALSSAPKASRLEGYDKTHRISDVAIHNMYAAGVAMNTPADVPLVLRNNHVSNVSVTPPGADGLPLVQISASDDDALEGLDAGVFTFTRAGSLEAPLTVHVVFAGSASAGEDYPTPGGSVTFAAGAQQVSISLMPFADALPEGDESVLATLMDPVEYSRDGTTTVPVAVRTAGEVPSPASSGRPARTNEVTTQPTAAQAHAAASARDSDGSPPSRAAASPETDRAHSSPPASGDRRPQRNGEGTATPGAGSGYRVASRSATLTIRNVHP